MQKGQLAVSEDRRCLVVDGHPVVRIGVRGLLDGRLRRRGGVGLARRAGRPDRDGRVRRRGRRARPRIRPKGESGGASMIRAIRKAMPGTGIVAHARRAERHALAEALDAGASAYVAKSSPAEALESAIEAAADSDRFVDPAADGQGIVPDPAPARGSSAPGRRAFHRRRRQPPRPERRNGAHPHQGHDPPPRGPRPRPRGRDRPALRPDRLGLDPAAVAGQEDGLGPVDGADLLVDVVQVRAHRADRKRQLLRDLLVDLALGKATKGIDLSGRQRAWLGRARGAPAPNAGTRTGAVGDPPRRCRPDPPRSRSASPETLLPAA